MSLSAIPSSSHRFPVVPATLSKPANVGTTIVNAVEDLVVAGVALKRLTDAAIRNGTRTVCAGTSIFAGLSTLATLNPATAPIGLAVAAAGGKELWDTFRTKSKDDVKNLLENASAGLGMIHVLEAKQIESFQSIKDNLTMIGNHVAQLNANLREIARIATYGQQELEVQKAKASDLYQESARLFEAAKQRFQAGHAVIQKSNATFSLANQDFERLLDFARNAEGDNSEKLDRFIAMAKNIHHTCKAGSAQLDKYNEHFKEAMDLFNQASLKRDEASLQAGKAVAMGQAHLNTIQELARTDERCTKLIAETRAEAMAGKDRSSHIQWIVDDVHHDLKCAQEALDSKVSWSSVILGGGTGAVIGSNFGPMGTVAGLLAGTKLADEAEKNMSLRQQMSEFSIDRLETPTTKSSVSFAFNKKSSGFWGRYQGRQSFTIGTLSIDLGDIKVNVPFNLNEKDKISKVHVLMLVQHLERRLLAGCITSEKCLEIIKKLETMNINRGKNHNPSVGFMPPRSPYFMELKSLCQNPAKLAQEKTKAAASNK